MTDSLVQKDSRNRRIHAAAETENNLVIADLSANFINSRVNERRRSPLTFASADIKSEIRKHLGTLGRMKDLRMELDRIGLLTLEMEGSIDNIIGRGNHLGISRKG